MTGLSASAGMIVMSLVILCFHAASLLFMAALLLEFRHIHAKRVALLSAFGTETAPEIRRRRLLMGAYAAATLAITAVSGALFVFQPHLL